MVGTVDGKTPAPVHTRFVNSLDNLCDKVDVAHRGVVTYPSSRIFNDSAATGIATFFCRFFDELI